MNEISAERTTRAARRRVFGNVVSRSEEPRVRTRLTDFERLARKRVTTSAAVSRVNVRQQRRVNTNLAQVSERANRNCQTRQARRDHLNRQTLVEIVACESERARNFCLLVSVVEFVQDLKLSLRHDHLDRPPVFKFNIDRQHSDSDFVKDA